MPPRASSGLLDDDSARRRCTLSVIAAMAAFAAVYSVLAYLRYRTYIYGGRFDLGNMVQAVCNTAEGHFLETTTADQAARQTSRLGSHVDPILAVFALPWVVWPSPVMLLTVQACIVAAGGWPLYRLGTRTLADPRAGALLAGTYLLYPALGFGVLDEFHPITLATPLLLFAFLYVEEDRWSAALPFIVLAAACKEEVPLVIACMGAYFVVRKRSWRPLLLTAAAIAYFVIAVWIVIPHYSVAGTPFVDRYAKYGETLGDMARNVLASPARVLTDLVAADNLRYWFDLLWPFAFMPLASPLTVLIAAPEFLLNGLSAKASQRNPELHYTGAEIPFLVVALVFGVKRIHVWLANHVGLLKASDLCIVVFTVCLAANYAWGPLPFPGLESRYSLASYARPPHALAIDSAVAMVPDDVVVSVSNNVGSHLSARRRVLTFPAYRGAAYVVVDERKPDVFDRFDPRAFGIALATLARDPAYELAYSRDGVYVFRRVSSDSTPSRTD